MGGPTRGISAPDNPALSPIQVHNPSTVIRWFSFQTHFRPIYLNGHRILAGAAQCQRPYRILSFTVSGVDTMESLRCELPNMVTS